MAHINLLPWRENQRKERNRNFGLQLLGVAVLAGAAAMSWYIMVQQQIEHQNSRNALLKAEIVQVDKKIVEIKNIERRRSQLISRMNVIQGLQVSRPQIVHLFDELVETIPEGAYLVNLDQKGSTVEMKGRAQSNARVSSYMRNIDSNLWMGGAQLKVIQAKNETGTGMSHFELAARQLNPNLKPKAKK
jgi:type IV pilus assembly protein PilN